MRIILDVPLNLNEIIKSVSGIEYSHTHRDAIVRAICTDSRKCQPNDLFIAIDGENDSGEIYVDDALAKNCFVISSTPKMGVIHVNETLTSLLKIASLYKSKTKIKHTVAVTGSVGKSTTVRFITKLLRTKYKVHAPYGNYNNHIGVPLTVLAAPKDTEILVVELGMNHSGEISVLSKCVCPDISVITSVGTSHIGNLGSRENIAKAKSEIIDGMNGGFILIPEKEPLLTNIKDGLTVSINTQTADYCLTSEDTGSLTFRSKSGVINDIYFFDQRRSLLHDLSFSIAVSHLLGLNQNEIKSATNAINDTDIRQRLIRLRNFSIYDDSYNSSLESVIDDFQYLSRLDVPTGAFLGDILELGEKSEVIHTQIGRAAAEYGISRLYLFGKNAEYIKNGAIAAGFDKANIFLNKDSSSPHISVEQIKRYSEFGEIILFKGSHRLRLDKIADEIAKEEKQSLD